jgi:hypothetical protein
LQDFLKNILLMGMKTRPGFFIVTTQPSAPETRQAPLYYALPRPHEATGTKALPAACPQQNTHGDKVVMPTDELIVVAKNPPDASVLKFFMIPIAFWCFYADYRNSRAHFCGTS